MGRSQALWALTAAARELIERIDELRLVVEELRLVLLDLLGELGHRCLQRRYVLVLRLLHVELCLSQLVEGVFVRLR